MNQRTIANGLFLAAARAAAPALLAAALAAAEPPARNPEPGEAAAAPAAASPGTFVYDITGDVDSLDPHWAYDIVSHMVGWQAYETLVFYKGPSVGEFEPLITTVVPSKANTFLSLDGRRYMFPIRKGVTFHDGTPLTPQDVKYSLLRFLLMDREGGPSSLLLEPILGIHTTREKNGRLRPGLFEAADAAINIQGNGVMVELAEPFAPFLDIVASFCPIVSKPWMISQGDWDGTAATLERLNNLPKERSPIYDKANGTGPFKLERWDKPGKRVTLARNDKYWRAPARLERLVIQTVDSPAVRRRHLASGEADAIMLERQFLPQVENLPDVVVEDELPLLEVTNAFVFNHRIDPEGNEDLGSGKLDGAGVPPDFFTDTDLRRALGHSFDYEGFIRTGFRGKARKALGPIPYGVSGYDENAHVPAFNPARATEQFHLAWKGQVWQRGFKLPVSYEEGRADRQLACDILKRNVETLNPKFHIECRPVQHSTLLTRFVAGKLPLTIVRWTLDYPGANSTVYPFLHSSGYFAKATAYSNLRTDRLVHDAARELDPDRRNALYREVQAMAAIDLPVFFTVDSYATRIRRSNVRDWWYNPILSHGYFYPAYKD